MGAPLDLIRKDGTKHEKWFKAANRVAMIYGNPRCPGWVCAWLPSLVLLVGECMLAKRAKVVASAGQRSTSSIVPLQLEGAAPARTSTERLL
eukprot:6195220-Pleurochrysis_carterae.AAC.4